MKHGSPVAPARSVDLQTTAEIKDRLRAQLDGTWSCKVRLAARLGITCHRLTLLLRTDAPVPAAVAATLGYRQVTRFERTS